MKKVTLTYILNGSIQVTQPQDFESMNIHQKKEWADNYLNKLADKEIVEGISQVSGAFNINQCLDEAPPCLSIELEGEDVESMVTPFYLTMRSNNSNPFVAIENENISSDSNKAFTLADFMAEQLLLEIKKRAADAGVVESYENIGLMLQKSCNYKIKDQLNNSVGVDAGNDNYYVCPEDYDGQSEIDDVIKKAKDFGINLINIY